MVGGQRGSLPSTTPRPLHPPPPPPLPQESGMYGSAVNSPGSLDDHLRLAASKGQVDRALELLQAGAGFGPDSEGRTALHYAAHNGHVDVCRLLIDRGCPLDLQDSMGHTPLIKACSQGLVDVVQLCLEAGCAVDFADENGNTALHETAWHGYSRSVELLIKHNADVFRVNKSGFTALHLAAQNGHNESTRVLLYGGIDADLQNNYGDTALHTAARYGHAGVTRILLSAKCKLNLPNKNGDTALHIAAALKRKKIAKILVEYRADVQVLNKQNETAVDVARRKEHPEIMLIISSLSRVHPTVPQMMETPGVVFKDDIEIEEGPVVCVEEPPPAKPEKEKRFGFSFFRKKKKDKDKEKDKAATSSPAAPATRKATATMPAFNRPTTQPMVPSRPVAGFFSQYMPRMGTQYYRDLAGNVKQGPVGYTAVCQCRPVMQHIQQTVNEAKEKLLGHIEASHQVLQDRIEQLDQEIVQQAHTLDPVTRERLEAERRACQAALSQRLQLERQNAQLLVDTYGDGLHGQVHDWLEDRLASYGHCLDHHHDDLALPPNNIFTDIHLGPDGGRLFKSRSDETLSASDNSGKGRKRQFYESRKAAMEQIRGWQVPHGKRRDSFSSKRRERGRSTDNLASREGRSREQHNNVSSQHRGSGPTASSGNVMTVAAEVHRSCDQLVEGVSSGPREDRAVDRRLDPPDRRVGGPHASTVSAAPERDIYFLEHSTQSGHSIRQPQQTRSQGNPSSQRNGMYGTAAVVSSRSQNHSQPRRGILRGKPKDSIVHERGRSSDRLQIGSSDRVAQGMRRPGPHPGGREGVPSGNAASSGREGNGTIGFNHQHNPLYGTAASVEDRTQHSYPSAMEDEGFHRVRSRTRSIDDALDGTDGLSDGRRRSRSEERVLDNDNYGQRYRAPVSMEEQSGYVTDSGIRTTYFDYSRQNHTHGGPGSRMTGSGYLLNFNAKPDSDNRTGGRFVLSGDTYETRPVSHERTSNDVSNLNYMRPVSGNRYVRESEATSRAEDFNKSVYSNPGQFRQQQQSHQSATRYRVLPPLPSADAESDARTYHHTPETSRAVDNQAVNDRTQSKPMTERDSPANPSHATGGSSDSLLYGALDTFKPYANDSPRGQGDQGGGKLFPGHSHLSAFQPRANSGGYSQDKHRLSRQAEGPWKVNGQANERPVHRSTNAIYSSVQKPRTSSPHHAQQPANDARTKSENSLNKDAGKEPSSRDLQPVSSGHYSVSNACLRHEDFSYSPVLNSDSKEDSTCSSNQDSGYSSRMVLGSQGKGYTAAGGGEEGRGVTSTTPSSSFSTDRSLSAGIPSNASSPYPNTGAHSFHDYVPTEGSPLEFQSTPNGQHRTYQQNYGTKQARSYYHKTEQGNSADTRPGDALAQQLRTSGTTPSPQPNSSDGANLQRQVQGWYQRRLLEAAQRLRNSEQYGKSAEGNIYSKSTTISLNYDPVHGSDV